VSSPFNVYLFAQAAAPTAAPAASATPTSSTTSTTSDQRSTSFRSVPGGEVLQSGEKLLVEAYAVIWVLLFGMLVLSWRRQKKMDERIAGLEQAVTAARSSVAKGAKEPLDKEAP